MDGSFLAVTISPQEPTGQSQPFWPGGGEFFKWLYPWGRELSLNTCMGRHNGVRRLINY